MHCAKNRKRASCFEIVQQKFFMDFQVPINARYSVHLILLDSVTLTASDEGTNYDSSHCAVSYVDLQ
jgi:hypothetical protein